MSSDFDINLAISAPYFRIVLTKLARSLRWRELGGSLRGNNLGENEVEADSSPTASIMRFALPNARIMVHQPSGGFQGQATDIMVHAQEILNLKKRLNEIYVKHTGQSLKKIEDALERDYFLTAEAAKDFGLVDKVIERRPEEMLPKPA